MKQDISKNIIKNTADYQEITEESNYLSWEIKELKQKQAEMNHPQGLLKVYRNSSKREKCIYVRTTPRKTFGEGIHNTASNDILRLLINHSSYVKQNSTSLRIARYSSQKKATKERMLTRLNQYKLELQEQNQYKLISSLLLLKNK